MDDQPRGDTVHDYSGNAFHGTASGDYSRSCSQFTMTGASAPATPQIIYVPPTFSAALAASTDVTFAAWVRLSSVGSMRVMRMSQCTATLNVIVIWFSTGSHLVALASTPCPAHTFQITISYSMYMMLPAMCVTVHRRAALGLL